MGELVDYNRIGAPEAQAMERILHVLLSSGQVAQTIADVVNEGDQPDATAFGRYASELLKNAGGLRLLKVRGADKLKIRKPENGRLAEIVNPPEFPPASMKTLLAVECSLNRLICIADAIADGREEQEPSKDEPRRSISILGGGYLGTRKGWRSTRIILPQIDQDDGATVSYYNEVDWRSTDCVASNARAVFQRSMRPNAYRTKQGVHVASQSEWDVRTRLAQLLRALELPHRYSFHFDYDGTTKTVEAKFTCPPPEFLPFLETRDSSDRANAVTSAYEAYLLRLTCLIAAACFGSGRDIETALVTGYKPSWDEALVSAELERNEFARSVLTCVDSNEMANPDLRFKPERIAEMIGATHLDWRGDSANLTSRHTAYPITTHRREPWEDERVLPPEAQRLFRCKRICDVDTSHYHGGYSDAVDAARYDSHDSTLAAVLRLESLVEELEASTHPPEGIPSARPLFAANALSRLAVSLLDDEMTIAAQAESFLKGSPEPSSKEGVFYYRAPDALFHARIGLSDLYHRMGDFQGAIMQADRCIALAPTTANAYLRKADVLAEQGYLEQAANVLIAGLRCCATKPDCSLLYYHLGLILWNQDKRHEAAITHLYNSSLTGEYAEKSSKAVKGLILNDDVPSITRYNPFSASRELVNLGLPLAPVNMRQQITHAVILLVNAGSPRAAAPYARALESRCNNDEVVIATCRSIYYGCAS